MSQNKGGGFYSSVNDGLDPTAALELVNGDKYQGWKGSHGKALVGQRRKMLGIIHA